MRAVLERGSVRDTPKSSKECRPINPGNNGQGSRQEPLLAAKVSPDTREIGTQYIVRARPIIAEMVKFWSLLNDGTIGAQEPDGNEIVASMRRAVMNGGKVEWSETCYCSPPLRHERATVYDKFFTDIEIGPPVAPALLEGESFWQYLDDWNKGKGSGQGHGIVSVARYVPVRIL